MTTGHVIPFFARQSDRLVAVAAATLALCVYLMTIYPGLFGVGDAAKFAFVGKVLGIPHAPGYPLYVAVSHLFSYVPLGTLAYRMNVLSALLGAVAVALHYLAGRALGLERAIAVSAALALGFGHAFWSKALYAKGYTLNAALVTAGILALLTWGSTRRPLHLYLAIGIFALSIGNHLIVIALLPALVLFALATDRRTALSLRTLLVTAGLVAAGLSQYLLILIRTRQHASYLEARASTLSELLDVMLARRWAHEIGAYQIADVVATRAPVVWQLLTTELTVAGLLLAGAGLVVLARRQPREAALLFLSAAGIVALTSNMSSNEDQGFLLPAFVMLWLLAGVGLQWVLDTVRHAWTRGGVRRAGWVTVPVLLAAAALPSSQLIANYRTNDHHNRTFEIRYFNAFFDMLPDKATIIEDRYTVNMMLTYKLLGEEAAAGRDVQMVTPIYESVTDRMRRGYQIFTFAEGRKKLVNLGYEFEPVQLFDLPLPLYLDVIRQDWTVALAATPDVAAQLRSNRAGWARLGVSARSLFEQKVGAPLALIGVNNAGGAAMESVGFPQASVAIGAGLEIGDTGRHAGAAISVTANRDEAVVSVGGIEQARTSRGVALVLIDPRGGISAYTLDGDHDLRLPFDMHIEPLFRVTGAISCADVGNAGWQDISTLAARQMAVRIDNYRPFLSRVIFYVEGAAPVPATLAEGSGQGATRMSVTTYRVSDAGDRAKLRVAALADRLAATMPGGTAPFVSRIEIAINDQGDHRAMRLDFGVVPIRSLVHAGVDLNNPKRATVCGIAPIPLPVP